TPMSFAVVLAPASSQPVTVDYQTVDGTAQAGTDYVATGGMLSFAAGQTLLTVTVNVIGDTADEPDEVFYISFTAANNAGLSNNLGTATIRNDDAVGLSANDAAVLEGDAGGTHASVPLTLTHATTRTVSAWYATSDGSATSVSDYSATSGVLTFAPGT